MLKKISTFSNRLNDAISNSQLTKADVARLTGINKSSITRYCKGDWEAKQDAVYLLASCLNVSEAWLMGYDVPMERKDSPSPLPANITPLPTMKRVPLIGTIACGTPILAVEDATEFIDAPEGIQNDIDFALECKGDSMINARIFPGDIVYIKQQPVVENGEIAAVLIGDEATLKRVYYTPGNDRITLQACNPLYSDMIYTGEQLNEIKILGKAVWFMSRVRI